MRGSRREDTSGLLLGDCASGHDALRLRLRLRLRLERLEGRLDVDRIRCDCRCGCGLTGDDYSVQDRNCGARVRDLDGGSVCAEGRCEVCRPNRRPRGMECSLRNAPGQSYEEAEGFNNNVGGSLAEGILLIYRTSGLYRDSKLWLGPKRCMSYQVRAALARLSY